MKSITADNHIVRPFATHKTQTYAYSYLGGGNPAQLTIDLATVPPTGSVNWSWQGLGPEPINPSGIGQRPLFKSIQHLFYDSSSVFYYRGGGFYPNNNAYVISIAQPSFGEGVLPGSVLITGGGAHQITDDSYGRLVTDDGNKVIGNVFYGMGIAVVQANLTGPTLITSGGLYMTTGSNVTVSFKATQTIYEHQIVCTMEAGETNYSVNPTMGRLTAAGEVPFNLAASGSLPPYMTTIGLYTDNNELIAIGKFPQPLKRAFSGQQTIILKFDT